MNARTFAAALAAIAVVAAIAWWALSGSPAPAAPSAGPGPGAAASSSRDETVDVPPGANPIPGDPAKPAEERDGVLTAPDSPPPGSASAKPAAPADPNGGRGPGGAMGRRGQGRPGAAGEDDGRVALPGVTESVEEFRRLLVTWALDSEAVMPNRGGWPREVEGRLEKYPTPRAWPNVLGHMETDAKNYRAVADPATGIGAKASGGFVLPEPLATTLTTENYVTLVCRKGIAEDGVWVSNSYCTLLCQGDMAGKVFFGSYATGVIDGALSGSVTAKTYCNLVVKGKFTGKIASDSYAMIHLLGGLEGSLELRGSKVYVKGKVPKSVLDGIQGRGTVYVDESDLTPGRQVLGDIVVHVGAEAFVEPAKKPEK